jgi:hypothetical protein
VPRQLLVLASVECARTAISYLDDETRGPALECLRVAEEWVWGRASLEEVRADADAAANAAWAAANAAWAAAYAAATAYADAANAAAAAARAAAARAAAAWADAANAARAAAYGTPRWHEVRDEKLAELAVLVRQVLPWPVVEAGERQWPARWFDADNFLEGLLIEAPVVDGLELVVFRDEGHVVEVVTSKDVLTVAGRMPNVLVAMDAAQEA